MAPDNAAAKTFAAQASGWTSATSNATAEAQAAVLVAADSKFNEILETTDWPTAAVADAHALAVDVSQCDALLQTLNTINFLDVDGWVQNFVSAEDQSDVEANIVRHDLGLPPGS